MDDSDGPIPGLACQGGDPQGRSDLQFSCNGHRASWTGIEDRLDHITDEFCDLVWAATDIQIGIQQHIEFVFVESKCRVGSDPFEQVIGCAFLFDAGTGCHAVLADLLVQVLAVAAALTASIMMFSVAMKGSSSRM